MNKIKISLSNNQLSLRRQKKSQLIHKDVGAFKQWMKRWVFQMCTKLPETCNWEQDN